MLTKGRSSITALGRSHSVVTFLGAAIITDTKRTPRVLPHHSKAPNTILYPVPFLHPHSVVADRTKLGNVRGRRRLLTTVASCCRRRCTSTYGLHNSRPLPVVTAKRLAAINTDGDSTIHSVCVNALSTFPTRGFPPTSCVTLKRVRHTRVVNNVRRIHCYNSPVPLDFSRYNGDGCIRLIAFSGNGLRDIRGLGMPMARPVTILGNSLTSVATRLRR